MDSILKERIDLLHNTKQISDEVYSRLPLIFEKVENKLNVKLSEENAGSFASHMSIALQRILEKKPVTELSSELKSVVEKNPHFYQFAKELLYTGNEETHIGAEAAFITLYFCLLTGEGNE